MSGLAQHRVQVRGWDSNPLRPATRDNTPQKASNWKFVNSGGGVTAALHSLACPNGTFLKVRYPGSVAISDLCVGAWRAGTACM